MASVIPMDYLRMRLPMLLLLGLLVWDTAQAAPPLVVRAHQRYLTALCFTPDEKTIITASDNGALKNWDAATGKLLKESKLETPLTALTMDTATNRLFVGAWNGSFQIWHPDRAKEPLVVKAHAENITALAVSTDGRWLATASGDDQAKIWDATTGKLLLTIEHGNEYDVTSVAFEPAGKWLLTGDGEGTVRIFDTTNGRELQRYTCHEETIAGAIFIDHGKKFITASWDDTIKVWDAVTGAELQCLVGHTDDVTCLALSRDGKTLASGSADRTVRCWNIATGKAVFTSPAGDDAITAVAITADGQRVAYGSGGKLTIQEVR